MHVHRVQGTNLYLGTVPRSAAHLAELHSLGVRAVVTLNQAWEPQIDGGVPKAAADAGMHHLNAPTPDFAAPTQRHLRAAVDFTEKHVNAGHGVYVHCNGGRGRSVVCLLGFLIRSKGMTAHEAYTLVAQHGQSAPSAAAPEVGSCASSGRAWQLRQARHSQAEAGPLGSRPLPRVLELAASKAAELAAFDPLEVASQRKIAKLVARPLGIPRPQWRALLLFEEAERMTTALAAAVGPKGGEGAESGEGGEGAESGEGAEGGAGARIEPARTKRSAKVAPA